MNRLRRIRMPSARKINEASIVFRRAIPDDAETLLEFARRTYYETFAAVNTPENMPIRNNIANSSSVVIALHFCQLVRLD